MDPEFLREFITIADTGNFSKAAAKLFVTQPTLSKHISALKKISDSGCLNAMR
ncbi:MAG: LysR family transcriptional regulator [Coriobacteriales bacterium]|nr:LysR family transcriptional regulator [Coriobacteriales bacterium]